MRYLNIALTLSSYTLILVLWLTMSGSVSAADGRTAPYADTKQVLIQLVTAGQTAVAHYQAYEIQARKENLPYIADLFKAMASSQLVMTRNFDNLLRKLGGTANICRLPSLKQWNTRKNLIVAIKKEIVETDHVYPEALKRITREGHAGGVAALENAVRAQRMHRQAMQAIYDAARSYYGLLKGELKRRDPTYYICQQSGAMLLDELPIICPVRGQSTASYRELRTLAVWENGPSCSPKGTQQPI